MKFKISCLCIAIASMIASAEPVKTTKFGDIKLDTDVNVELISKGTIDGEKIITSKDLLLYEPDTEKINALETKVNGFDQRITDAETKATNAETKANKVDGLETKVNTLDDTVNNKLDTIISDKVGDIVVSDEAINKAVGNKMNEIKTDNQVFRHRFSIVPRNTANTTAITDRNILFFPAKSFHLTSLDFETNSNSDVTMDFNDPNNTNFMNVVAYEVKVKDRTIDKIEILQDCNNTIFAITKDNLIIPSGSKGEVRLKIYFSPSNYEPIEVNLKILSVAWKYKWALTENYRSAFHEFEFYRFSPFPIIIEKQNSYRYAVSSNALAHIKLVNTNDTVAFTRCRDASISKGYVTKYYPRQMHLFGNNGENKAERIIREANTNFFWPEMGDGLRFSSIEKSPGPYTAGVFAKYMISPHYYITSKHCFWPWSSYSTFCIDRKNQKFVSLGWNPNKEDPLGSLSKKWGAGNDPYEVTGDLYVWKFNEGEFPKELCMKFCPDNILKNISYSKLYLSLGFYTTSHNTVSPGFLGKPGSFILPPKLINSYISWLSKSDIDYINNTSHFWDYKMNGAHTGCSSRLMFMMTPNNKIIPYGLFWMSGGSGPVLTNPSVIKRIKDFVEKDSGGKETIQCWTYDELTNSLPANLFNK